MLLAPQDELRRDVARHTVRAAVAEKLAAFVASGILAVGDELPGERDLASALAVSRDTVRGAIQTLAAHGILMVSHGSRTVVAKTDVSALPMRIASRQGVEAYDLESVHRARLLIEASVAADAARLIDDATLGRLRASIVAQEACLEDPVRFLICDREFHVAIYRASGNPLLADIATDLYAYLLEFRRRAISRVGSIAISIADHRDILGSLEARDADRLIAAFARHETRIYDTTRRLLAEEAGRAGSLAD